jgi:hypothetical protein
MANMRFLSFRANPAAVALWYAAGVAVLGVVLSMHRGVVLGAVAVSTIGSMAYWRWYYRRGRRDWEARTRTEIYRQAVESAAQRISVRRQQQEAAEAAGGAVREPSRSRDLLLLADVMGWGYGLVDHVDAASKSLGDADWAPPNVPPPEFPSPPGELAPVQEEVAAAVRFLADFGDPAKRARRFADLAPRERRERWTQEAAVHAKAIWRASNDASRRVAASGVPANVRPA